MPRLREDATTALLRAIVNFMNFEVSFEEIRSRSWASVTFTGARHEVALRMEGEGAGEVGDRFCANLSDAEFDLRGHILADISLIAHEALPEGGVRIRFEALTVEDA
jgi:hypothetical protein